MKELNIKTPKTQMFEGKLYKIVGEDVTLKGANRRADDERGIGKIVRIVPLDTHEGRTFFGIYSRDADSDIETQRIIEKRFAIVKRTAFKNQKQ